MHSNAFNKSRVIDGKVNTKWEFVLRLAKEYGIQLNDYSGLERFIFPTARLAQVGKTKELPNLPTSCTYLFDGLRGQGLRIDLEDNDSFFYSSQGDIKSIEDALSSGSYLLDMNLGDLDFKDKEVTGFLTGVRLYYSQYIFHHIDLTVKEWAESVLYYSKKRMEFSKTVRSMSDSELISAFSFTVEDYYLVLQKFKSAEGDLLEAINTVLPQLEDSRHIRAYLAILGMVEREAKMLDSEKYWRGTIDLALELIRDKMADDPTREFIGV